MSAGAVEPGLAAALRLFDGTARVTYATAPRLRERMLAGEAPDLLVAPVPLIEELTQAGRLTGARAAIGRVGVGVAVRPETPDPAIRDAASLRAAVEAADAIVFNRASTGLTMEGLFERLGLTAIVAGKARRHATGAEVLEDVLRSPGRDIAFGAITEIHLVPALRFAGPLPPGLQNSTAYAAAVPQGGAGSALLRFLATPAARAALDAAGVTAQP